MNQHQFSQELQAEAATTISTMHLVLYYFTEGAVDAAATPNTNRWNADGTGFTLLDPQPTVPAFRSIDRAMGACKKYCGLLPFRPDTGIHRYIAPDSVVGRKTKDDKSGLLYKVNNADTNLTFDLELDHFDPLSLTLAYDATDDVHLYAKYASRYRSGGASSRSLIYRSFGPESVKSYEVGAKTATV